MFVSRSIDSMLIIPKKLPGGQVCSTLVGAGVCTRCWRIFFQVRGYVVRCPTLSLCTALQEPCGDDVGLIY